MKNFHLYLKTLGLMLATLMMSVSMVSCSDDDDPKPDDNEGQTGQYAGRNFVGTWEGSDGSDSFAIVLGEDGSYTDYMLVGGQRKNSKSGKYSVNGDKITVPTNSNLYNAWAEVTYTFSVSGKNMTITCPLMIDWGQKLTLTKQ